MKNSFGNSVILTLFGESHGSAVGFVLDGLAPGINVDCEYIKSRLSLRRPVSALSTARSEPDEFVIESGVLNGKTTGTPLCMIIPNVNVHSGDYEELENKPRPGHADYTARCKYHGLEDPRGGGHFSGRVTAAVVAAGAIAQTALRMKNITVGTHLSRCAGIQDRPFFDLSADLSALNDEVFAVLDQEAAEKMKSGILAAAKMGDSVGGILETAVTGLPAGLGEPWFDSVESMLSHALFGIPAVKGVEFGDGFGFADLFGHEANDAFEIKDGAVVTRTNHNGGLNGGITNGMPLLFRCVVKPTPSVSLPQATVDLKTMTKTELQISGRHDPCIVHRARAVVDALTAIVLLDLLSARFGTDYFAGEKAE